MICLKVGANLFHVTIALSYQWVILYCLCFVENVLNEKLFFYYLPQRRAVLFEAITNTKQKHCVYQYVQIGHIKLSSKYFRMQ